MKKNTPSRSSFSGGIGFVLAAAGSAVGLGNLWRFPYLAAQYGGGIFILVYLVLTLTFGYTLMCTEIGIGRKTKQSPSTAYSTLHPKFRFLNMLATIVPIIILPYYCVIGGWVTKYMMTFLRGMGKQAAQDNYFSGFAGSTAPALAFFGIFLAVTTIIILLGVNKGIENMSKYLMPCLVVLSIIICCYVCSLHGIGDGLKYYLLPDIHKFSILTICAATGQMFFSMSLAMGIMITYGSYTRDEIDLTKSVNRIEIFDTGIALMAGLMIVPAVFMFSGEAGTRSSGAGLMFITLPKVFEKMYAGNIIGAMFFVLVFFAALTSSVSIMEAVVSSFMDRFKIKRAKATWIAVAIAILLGIPSSLGNGIWSNVKILGMDFLTFFDFVSNSLIMPVVALLTCILVGWVLGPKSITNEITKNGEKMGRKKMYNIVVRYIAPVLLVIILVSSTLSQFGVIHM